MIFKHFVLVILSVWIVAVSLTRADETPTPSPGRPEMEQAASDWLDSPRSGRGPYGFKPAEMEQSLIWTLTEGGATTPNQ